MMGGLSDIMFKMFLPSVPSLLFEEHYITRRPLPLPPYLSTLRPFSLQVWIATFATLSLFSIVFLLTYKVYSNKNVAYANLTKKEGDLCRFVYLPIFGLTEPEVLPWFKDAWSSGKLATLLWQVFMLFTIMFYVSTLRAGMTVITYESEPNSMLDILNREKTVYIAREFFKHT